MTTKTLSQLADEVEANCREKGWYDTPVTYGEAMALLHSEVSEMLEAYRSHGLADATNDMQHGKLAKPEGVGSEAADVFIRLLDYGRRFNEPLREDALVPEPRTYAIFDNFGEEIAGLHAVIAMPAPLNVVLGALSSFCGKHGIDLMAETERKMAYNATRPHRHGGKRL